MQLNCLRTSVLNWLPHGVSVVRKTYSSFADNSKPSHLFTKQTLKEMFAFTRISFDRDTQLISTDCVNYINGSANLL